MREFVWTVDDQGNDSEGKLLVEEGEFWGVHQNVDDDWVEEIENCNVVSGVVVVLNQELKGALVNVESIFLDVGVCALRAVLDNAN